MTKDFAVWCERCGHSHHLVLGSLAQGQIGCQKSLSTGPLASWRSWASGRSLNLTPLGQRAVANILRIEETPRD